MKKNLFHLFFVTVMIMQAFLSYAQDAERLPLIVLNIDAQGIELDPMQMGNLVRLELDKLDRFEVMDKYDVAYLVEKNQLDIKNCYGKICLMEVGELLKAKKMITGSTERYGEMIIMTLRLIDIEKGVIEKTEVVEFLNLQNELQQMVGITLRNMFDLENEKLLVDRLTKKYDLENAINYPNQSQLNLSGPRMGLNILTGDAAKIYQDPESIGGFDGLPFMFMFGYQFEVQYLNEGNVQGLFELIPMIAGVEQGQLIPSLTLLHGIRLNSNGLEFAFGPTVTASRQTRGYYDAENVWRLPNEWTGSDPNPFSFEDRLDSRGDLRATPGFVFAGGFTLKSGKLNIPLNAFVVTSKKNFRLGFSVGFNAISKRR